MSDRPRIPGSGPRRADQIAASAGPRAATPGEGEEAQGAWPGIAPDRLTQLWRTAARLQRLTHCVRAALPQDLAAQVQVTQLRGGVLTLLVSNAAWATRMRLAAADLQYALALLPDFDGLRRVQTRIATATRDGDQPPPV